MSVGLSLWLRDRGLPQLRGLVLVYPVLGADTDTESYRRNEHAPCLTRDEMTFYLESFLGLRGSANWRDPYAVPNAAGDLSSLPPTFIAVAEHDPLCDDGANFCRRLIDAGVDCRLRREPALAHSYMRARHVSAPAKEGFDAIVEAVHLLAHEGMLPPRTPPA
jgi:acetyl esterase